MKNGISRLKYYKHGMNHLSTGAGFLPSALGPRSAKEICWEATTTTTIHSPINCTNICRNMPQALTIWQGVYTVYTNKRVLDLHLHLLVKIENLENDENLS